MAELITERIRRNARELKLYGLADSADSLVERAEQAGLGYREFLDLVLEDEVGVLEGRRYASRLKLSALPHHKTLDEFDTSFQPELDPKRLRELRSLRFLERRVSLLIFGPPGVGKSHIAVGLAMEALRRGYLVGYTTLRDCCLTADGRGGLASGTGYRMRDCDRHGEALRDFGEVLRERLVFDEALRERLVFDGLAVRRHRVQQVGIDRVVAAVAPDCVGSLVEGVDHVAALAAVHAVSARPAADGRREHHVEDAADKDLVGLVAEVHRNPFHIHRRAGRARAKTGH